MATIISVFNHKSGVGKTTIVFHLGWMMANLGKKVLIVDADPQCNLTGLTLGLEDNEALFQFYDSKQNTDIYNSLVPLFSIDSEYSSVQSTAIAPTKNANLFILAGNIKFSELDIQIATAMTSSSALPVLHKFVGAFRQLMVRIIKERNIDIVLVDMSPSVSATNQTIFMSSDYFIIPISPDFYCHQAIDSLSNLLPKWSEVAKSFRRNDDFSLPKKDPRMLGFISQNYRIYTTDNTVKDGKDQKRMSKAYSEWLEKIRELANKTLVPKLHEHEMVVPVELFVQYVKHDKPYHLASIQNFNSMIPTSQKKSKPMFELTQEDGGWSGAVWAKKDEKTGQHHGVEVNIKESKKIFLDLAEATINIINHDS